MKVVYRKELAVYITSDGDRPFIDWMDRLKDKKARYRIKERLDRVRLGNLGNYKSLGDRLFELRFTFGSGYRIYFGMEEGNQVVLLLCGGDKRSQKRDVKRAVIFWNDFRVR